MLAILTPAEAAALDRESGERGVGVSTLMENAGLAVARATVEAAGGSYGRRAVVVCGKGNNGGDGLVAARVLERGGMGVSVVLLSDPAAFTGAAADAFRTFDAGGGRWLPFSPDTMSRELSRAAVAVDAIFGTGFRGAAEGPHAAAIHALNEAGLPVVAVDIPSGVEGESGAVHGEAVPGPNHGDPRRAQAWGRVLARRRAGRPRGGGRYRVPGRSRPKRPASGRTRRRRARAAPAPGGRAQAVDGRRGRGGRVAAHARRRRARRDGGLPVRRRARDRGGGGRGRAGRPGATR